MKSTNKTVKVKEEKYASHNAFHRGDNLG